MENIEKALHILNSAFRRDREAIITLLSNGVPCNIALSNHRIILVNKTSDMIEDGYNVSALSLINGIVESLTGKRITYKWSTEVNSDGERILEGFIEDIEN